MDMNYTIIRLVFSYNYKYLLLTCKKTQFNHNIKQLWIYRKQIKEIASMLESIALYLPITILIV